MMTVEVENNESRRFFGRPGKGLRGELSKLKSNASVSSDDSNENVFMMKYLNQSVSQGIQLHEEDCSNTEDCSTSSSWDDGSAILMSSPATTTTTTPSSLLAIPPPTRGVKKALSSKPLLESSPHAPKPNPDFQYQQLGAQASIIASPRSSSNKAPSEPKRSTHPPLVRQLSSARSFRVKRGSLARSTSSQSLSSSLHSPSATASTASKLNPPLSRTKPSRTLSSSKARGDNSDKKKNTASTSSYFPKRLVRTVSSRSVAGERKFSMGSISAQKSSPKSKSSSRPSSPSTTASAASSKNKKGDKSSPYLSASSLLEGSSTHGRSPSKNKSSRKKKSKSTTDSSLDSSTHSLPALGASNSSKDGSFRSRAVAEYERLLHETNDSSHMDRKVLERFEYQSPSTSAQQIVRKKKNKLDSLSVSDHFLGSCSASAEERYLQILEDTNDSLRSSKLQGRSLSVE